MRDYVIGGYQCHMAAKASVLVDEDHDKLLTLYWLPKLLKRPCTSRLLLIQVRVLLVSRLYFNFLSHCH